MFQKYYGPIEKNVICQLYHYLAVQCKAEPLIWANVYFDQNINTQNDLALLCDLSPWQPGQMPSFDLSILLIKKASRNSGITFNCSEYEDNIIGVQMSRIWGYFMHTSGPYITSAWPVLNAYSLFSFSEHSSWHRIFLSSLTTFQICSSPLIIGCNKNTLFRYLMLCMSPPIANVYMKKHSHHYSKSEISTCINCICKQGLFTDFFTFWFCLMTRKKYTIFKVTLLLLSERHNMMVQPTAERYDVNIDSQWVPRYGIFLV